jgi:hypothetical protein
MDPKKILTELETILCLFRQTCNFDQSLKEIAVALPAMAHKYTAVANLEI